MAAYAASTRTHRNLAALRAHGWRIMVAPADLWPPKGFPIALDNGAWAAHTASKEWDPAAFEKALALFGPSADFVVAPDIVRGGPASLERTRAWIPRLLTETDCPILVAVQDGMDAEEIRALLLTSARLGVFVGGSTEWKKRTLPLWGRLGRQLGRMCHVGRVNTARRIHLCGLAGATSFDGSAVTRFAVNIELLDRARRAAVHVDHQGRTQSVFDFEEG